MRPGGDQKIDYEYILNGTYSIFAFIEPLGGTHHASVHEQLKIHNCIKYKHYKSSKKHKFFTSYNHALNALTCIYWMIRI